MCVRHDRNINPGSYNYERSTTDPYHHLSLMREEWVEFLECVLHILSWLAFSRRPKTQQSLLFFLPIFIVWIGRVNQTGVIGVNNEYIYILTKFTLAYYKRIL